MQTRRVWKSCRRRRSTRNRVHVWSHAHGGRGLARNKNRLSSYPLGLVRRKQPSLTINGVKTAPGSRLVLTRTFFIGSPSCSVLGTRPYRFFGNKLYDVFRRWENIHKTYTARCCMAWYLFISFHRSRQKFTNKTNTVCRFRIPRRYGKRSSTR